MKKVLVSINGNQDPFSETSGRAAADGPILSLLANSSDFDEVVLFFTPDHGKAVMKIRAVITERYPAIQLRVAELTGLDDPTNYETILKTLRAGLSTHCRPEPSMRYWVSVSSGTSQMHACWLLLTASGEFDATVIQVREKGLVKEGQPLISEINPRVTEYPLVRPHLTLETIAQITPRKIEDARSACGIIASDPKMRTALEQAANTAQHEHETILITGPSGSGKELIAHFIHKVGKRRNRNFGPLNCGAIPENLIESQLFGHVKGAFTGADRSRQGIIEAHHGGTVFLDEIGEMPLAAQTRLLRVLDQREVTPVGSSTTRKVDVQFVAATNRDLQEAIHQQLFREDLYYRLSAHTIVLPPLADRREDIPELAAALLADFNTRYDKPHRTFTANAIDKLRRYHWPGNIRELKNVINRAAVNCPNEAIGSEYIHIQRAGTDAFRFLPEPEEGFKLDSFIDDVRSRLYERALELANGKGSQAAAMLGVSAQAVHKYRNKYRS